MGRAVLLAVLTALLALGQPVHPSAGIWIGTWLDRVWDVRTAQGRNAAKVLLDWSRIEARPHRFDWAEADRMVQASSDARLRIVGVLAYTPLWASVAEGEDRKDPRSWRHQPPRDLGAWRWFVRQAVTRYRGRIGAWQIWTPLEVRTFRGTARDYTDLLTAASEEIRRLDPRALVVASTPVGVDLAFVRALLRSHGRRIDGITLAPLGLGLEKAMRALGRLQADLMAPADGRLFWWLEWTASPTDLAARMAAIALGCGARGVFTSPDADLIRAVGLVVDRIGDRRVSGFLDRGPEVTALVFQGGVGVWWGSGVVDVPFARGWDVRGHPLAPGPLRLDGRTAVLAGLSSELVEEARKTLERAGALEPVVPPHRDFRNASSVSARLGAQNEEQGLYNMPYRSRPNGAVSVVRVGDEEAVQLQAARGIVYVYFDVDDTFLFFNNGRYDVEVSVEVRGASAPGQLGFNLFYDSDTGYRFTTWQVVDARPEWITYTFRLPDANFANTWGWDFAVNGAGNRHEDLVVRQVTVRRIPRAVR